MAPLLWMGGGQDKTSDLLWLTKTICSASCILSQGSILQEKSVIEVPPPLTKVNTWAPLARPLVANQLSWNISTCNFAVLVLQPRTREANRSEERWIRQCHSLPCVKFGQKGVLSLRLFQVFCDNSRRFYYNFMFFLLRQRERSCNDALIDED